MSGNGLESLAVADLRSALDDDRDVCFDISGNKMNPLKTNKQRNNLTSIHRKHLYGRNECNSSDEEVGKGSGRMWNPSTAPSQAANSCKDKEPAKSNVSLSSELQHSPSPDSFCANPASSNFQPPDDSICCADSEDNYNLESCGTPADNIADRICCLSELNLHGHGAHESVKSPSKMIPVPGRRALSYPSLAESDSLNDCCGKPNSNPHTVLPSVSSSGCLATTGGVDDYPERRSRRRRRRRGHESNSKRMAVDASPVSPVDLDRDRHGKCYSVRGPEYSGSSYRLSKVGCHHVNKKVGKVCDGDSADGLGTKRKRPTGISCQATVSDSTQFSSGASTGDPDFEINTSLGAVNLCCPDIQQDEEMKSDLEEYYSSLDSENDGDEDEERAREADDEQSDWVVDEWGPKRSNEESSLSKKKKLLKMLRSYNNMIAANAAGGDLSLVNCNGSQREIRAGKRRVQIHRAGFPSKGMVANEQVSKFLQNPMQSQIRLPPMSAEDGVHLSHIASLYSLRMEMDFCRPVGEEQLDLEEMSNMPEDLEMMEGQLCPVLTKTSNTTQMDKVQDAVSPLNNGEGSSSSNVSSVYCVNSDADSKTSDPKRIKK